MIRHVWRCLYAMLAVVLLTIAVPQAAWAHVELSSSDPADKSVITTAPKQVVLRFSGPVKSAYTVVSVTGPGGATFHTGTPAVLDGVVTQPLTDLRPGAYTVAYQVVSADGDPVTGAITFTANIPGPSVTADAIASQEFQSQPAKDTGSSAKGWLAWLTLPAVMAAVILFWRRKTHAQQRTS